MTATLTQFTITEPATGYWRVTFSNPPINLLDPDTILEPQQLIGAHRAAPAVRRAGYATDGTQAVLKLSRGRRPNLHGAAKCATRSRSRGDDKGVSRQEPQRNASLFDDQEQEQPEQLVAEVERQ